MLESLAGLLVQQPGRLLAVALVLLAAWRSLRRPNPLWIPGLLWLAYAGWEWLVVTRTPEANIRVDLMLIWPVVGLATLWAVVSIAWRRWRGGKGRTPAE